MLVCDDQGVLCFKQKTAYEIKYGLVGSEMCIRDRNSAAKRQRPATTGMAMEPERATLPNGRAALRSETVSYTHLTLPTSDLV